MVLDREWEKFKGGPTQALEERVHVTINGKGHLYFNSNAYRLIGRPEAVHLYFNRQRDTIAVSPAASARLNDAFPVKEKTNGCRLVLASPFCQHFGIQLDSTQKFVAAELDKNGNMLLDLSNTVTVAHLRQRKRRS